ncbi:MAG: FG-GAP-like repeat-containing protein [Deltaproteobacteria bacterium]|nr:FG-GAP-like repeat-containing protein [Deltaproteobacteria bacterium]
MRARGMAGMLVGAALGGCTGSDAPATPDAGSNLAPVDVAPDVPSPSLGRGFTDLSAPMDSAPPFAVSQMVQLGDGDPDPVSGFFSDLDGDGRPEIVVSPTVTTGSRSAHVYGYDAAAGALVDRGTVHTARITNGITLMSALDLDDDGRVDLFSSRWGAEIAWGSAGGFEDFTSMTPPTPMMLPGHHGAYFDDLDQDGWLDVLGGNMICCVDCRDVRIFLRTSLRGFTNRLDLLPKGSGATAYAVLSSRHGDDVVLTAVGQPCGNQDTPAFHRQSGLDALGFPQYAAFDPIPPDAFIRLREPPQARSSHLSRWAPMGAAAADIDSDGLTDLAISLNFYSGVFQRRQAWPFYDWSAQFGSRPQVTANGQRQIPWGTALVDFDLDGRPDLVTANGNDHATWTIPELFTGPQRATFYWNAGGFTYRDMTAEARIGRPGQWRALAVDDLDGDGDPDLIVGGQGEYPRVFRNDIEAGNHGLAVTLHGTTSNPLGVGARLDVELDDGARQVHVAGGMASPLVVSAPKVFIGLGRATRAARLRITWPSGTVQELRDVPMGALRVEEPPSISLDPAGRHVPADGRSTVRLRVTPRSADGAVRDGARVEATVRYGAGQVTGGAWRDGAWEATVTAPSAAGSGVLEVRVDGVALGVRPRLWWD